MEHTGERNGQAASRPFGLRRDPWGRLVLVEAGGREHVGVEPVRAFPLSDPDHGIAVCDAAGRELAWVETLADLPADAARLLEEDLARRAFLPVIRRVLAVSAPVEPSEWRVETDRGPARFLLSSDEDVHRLDDGRALVTDAHGVRYLIADLSALDPTSRRLLERYL